MLSVRSTLLGLVMTSFLGVSFAHAQTSGLPRAASVPNTTNISPDLYVKHKRATNAPPELAHCRMMSVEVNGRMQMRRQCITPASNY